MKPFGTVDGTVKLRWLLLLPAAMLASTVHAQNGAADQDTAFYLVQADAAMREGRFVQAAQMIDWLEKNPGATVTDDVYLLKAELAIARNDVGGAENALLGLQYADRNLCRQEAAKGWVAGNRNRLDIAIIALAKAAKSCSEDAGIWNLLGLAFMRKGETEAGKQAFDQALMLEPANPDILNNHALMLVQNGDLQLAMQELAQASQVAPANRMISANRDFVSGMLGEAPVRQATESDRGWSQRMLNVAKGAKAAERGAEASALFARALLLLDRFDANVWSEISIQAEAAR
jgi:Flp pilus assembly protein TadD